MNTIIAILVLALAVAAIAALLERTHRREAGYPHAPTGANPAVNADLQRVLHDLHARV